MSKLKVPPKLYLVLGILIIVILIIGTLYKGRLIQQTKPDPCLSVTGTEIFGGDLLFSKKDLCYRRYAEEIGDISWCARSKASNGNDLRCVINVARSTGNVSICDSLVEGKERNKSQCLFEVAVANKIPEICSKIIDLYYRNRCSEAIR